MLSRLKILLFIPLFLLGRPALFAQDNDYMKHGKVFDLCSFKKTCFDCFNCNKNKVSVKIKNKVNKKITKISYVYYSQVYNKILTKEAQIQGEVIDFNTIGYLTICVPDMRHWAISELTYEDGTSNKYKVMDRLETFLQEPDECDCND